MRVDDLKYFQTRSKPVLRKTLLLIKRSNVYGLLTGEVTDISNICQLVLHVQCYDFNKEKVETNFIDCSNLPKILHLPPTL